MLRPSDNTQVGRIQGCPSLHRQIKEGANANDNDSTEEKSDLLVQVLKSRYWSCGVEYLGGWG